MEDKKSATVTVLAAMEKNSDNISFNELEKSTGLSFTELSSVIGLLAKENRLLMRVNHFTKTTCFYKSAHDALYARFMDFVHHRQERSVAFYASKMCITAKYLTMAVKVACGKIPSECIREETIREIERMLCHSQMPIKEIAYQLNFPNVSFFGKYFKMQKSMSHGRYRYTLYLFDITFDSVEGVQNRHALFWATDIVMGT